MLHCLSVLIPVLVLLVLFLWTHPLFCQYGLEPRCSRLTLFRSSLNEPISASVPQIHICLLTIYQEMSTCKFQPLEWTAAFRVSLRTLAGFLCQPAPPRSSGCSWNRWEQMAATEVFLVGFTCACAEHMLYLSWSLKCPSLAVVRDNSSSHPKADSCTGGAESLFSTADNEESQWWPNLL